ncbi:MAG: DNA repair protein RecN [Anaerolineae bacterium]
MLTELFIQNFAIIEDLRLQFDAGFNVLTGETGAGKSIIIDAVMLVLGGRADTSVVRAGADTAYVEAAFLPKASIRALLAPLLAKEGLEDESGGDYLLLAREVRANGRSIARVNGRTVSLSLLRQIAGPLIDIHGQGDHLSLLQPRSHLPLLDAYAGLAAECAAVARAVSEFQAVRRELDELRQDERTRAQRMDMLQFQIQEISAAGLQPGEEEELRAERTRLANAEQLMRAAAEATALMTGEVDAETPPIIDQMSLVERALGQLARFDESQGALLEQWQGLAFQFSELAAEVQQYLDGLEFNPGRLNYVEERLELIGSLKRKYGDDILAILAVAAEARAELERLDQSDERVEQLEAECEHRLRQIGRLAGELSQKRRAAAEKLSAVVEQQLEELSMGGTRFSVQFECVPAADGAYVGEQRLAFGKTGIDRVSFLISTNPGEPLKPMARIASGGETARLMLALKSALMQADATPTLIFDEIDQGIGGRVGDVVGRKLWDLTATSRHQVIVVTHLPQLAGYADLHFQVRKQVADGRTTTIVRPLDMVGRIDELAAMLGTEDAYAVGGAESILRQATAVKKQLATAR